MMKKCVYTCIVGTYDILINPGYINKDFDYICFTDQQIKDPGIWEIRSLPNDIEIDDYNMINRYIKMHPHILLKDYDLTVYIDGNVYIQNDLNEFINKYNDDFIVFHHNYGNDYYREVNRCLRQLKDDSRKITNQYHYYTIEGFDGGTLSYNGILFRKNSDYNAKINELWYNEINVKSKRDQLALPYLVWKYKLNVKYVDYEESFKYFFITTHNRYDFTKTQLSNLYNKDQKVALCCVTCNENHFLDDFINHYKNLGINHIFIYDCNNNDNTINHNYGSDESITIIKWKYENNIKEVLEAYQDCYDNRLNEYDWCCFFNMNEFLQIPNEKSINKYLAHTEFDNKNVIFVNWAIIDDKSENINFYMRKENRMFKSICRCNQEGISWVNSNSTHMPEVDENYVITSSGINDFRFNYDGFIKYYKYDCAMLVFYPCFMSEEQADFYNRILNYI